MGDTGVRMPKDAMVILSLLEEMGVSCHEPRVVNQLLEFIYRYVTCICEEARAYSTYAKKKMIDIDDIKLAIKMIADKSYSTVPPREMLLDVAKQKNMVPLPLIKSSSGLRLPPDRFCLTQPNYQLQFYKRAIASTASTPQVTRLPTSAGVFKTPSNLPPRSVAATTTGTPVTASSNLPTFRVLSASPATSTTQPTIRVVTQSQLSQQPQQSVISTGVKRKLSEDSDSTFGSF